MLKDVLRDALPPRLWRSLGWISSLGERLRGSGSHIPAPETVDYYANASWYALERLHESGDVRAMTLLSASARINHLPDYVTIFRRVYHASRVPARLPIEPGAYGDRLILIEGDFFDLTPLSVDCVISHSTFHCLDDSRYANERPGERQDEWRAYLAAAQLRRIIGARAVPCFITVAVNHEENRADNNAWVGHAKFVDSFTAAGFTLRDVFFDYMSGGAQRPQDFDAARFRRSPRLPEPGDPRLKYVAGTYYFS